MRCTFFSTLTIAAFLAQEMVTAISLAALAPHQEGQLCDNFAELEPQDLPPAASFAEEQT